MIVTDSVLIGVSSVTVVVAGLFSVMVIGSADLEGGDMVMVIGIVGNGASFEILVSSTGASVADRVVGSVTLVAIETGTEVVGSLLAVG